MSPALLVRIVALLTIVQAPPLLAEENASAATTGKIYKSSDALGRPVFSDQAPANAEELKLRKPTSFSMPALPPSAPPQRTETTAFARYTRLDIVSPDQNATIRDNAGSLALRFSVQPNLKKGHQLDLLLDGEPRPSVPSSGMNLANIDRGQHQLQLQVVDRRGKVLQTGPPVSVTLHRFSKLHNRSN